MAQESKPLFTSLPYSNWTLRTSKIDVKTSREYNFVSFIRDVIDEYFDMMIRMDEHKNHENGLKFLTIQLAS